MYDRYIREYRHYAVQYGPDTAIFLLVGKFYELYDYVDPKTGVPQTSMRRATECMDIACKEKKQDAPGKATGLFGGFPMEHLHEYAGRLTRRNWTVVIIDQVRDDHGDVKSRELARILTPATHIEASSSDALYFGALWLDAAAWSQKGMNEPPSFAAAAVELTTGDVRTYEGVAQGRRAGWSSDEMFHFFQVHPPRELVVWWKGDEIDMPDETTLCRIVGIVPARTKLYVRSAKSVGLQAQKEIVRGEFLRKLFRLKSVLPWREALGLGAGATEMILYAALAHIQELYPSLVERLRLPIAWNPAETVTLGNHALLQLNMLTAQEEDSVLAMFLRTATQMGRRAMRRRLLSPISHAPTLEKRYEEVDWCLRAAGAAAPVWDALRMMSDLARLHRKLTEGSMNSEMCLMLDTSYRMSQRLVQLLADSPLAAGAALTTPFQAFLTKFEAIFSAEKACKNNEDMFCLTDVAGPESAALEAEIRKTRDEMDAAFSTMCFWLGEVEGALKRDEKEASVVINGSKTLMTRVQKKLKTETPPAALAGLAVHARKASSSIELPVMNQKYHRLMELQMELAATGRREARAHCDALATEFADMWDALEEWVARVDVTMSLARVAEERGFTRPRLVADADGAAFDATGLRHPLIEAQASRVEYVRHAVSLGARGSGGADGWLVYGMNASGKSSLMKAVGITTILAQCGSFVPAESLRITPFRAIFTRILSSDNLWAGLSSFAVEMTELREILERADAWSLVLGDEVCSGTESESATAIVAATLERFEQRGVRYMFATHLHGLQAVPAVAGLRRLRTWHLRVRHDPATEKLHYDRTLHPGPGSSLYGLEVAMAMGLPAGVLESARKIRRALAGTVAQEEAVGSSWNTTVTRRACEVCSAEIVRDLEVHHIRPRAEAGAGGRFSDGSSMNAGRNLVVVCAGCHDRHHAGEIEIGPVRQTSDGPERQVMDLQRFAWRGREASSGSGGGSSEDGGATETVSVTTSQQSGGLTGEQLRIVMERLRQYPNCPPSRMRFDLEEEHGIRVSLQRLRAIRGGLGAAS